jgi:quinol monooxygenase YgiN
MVIRIVKMTFNSSQTADFLEIFNKSKEKIRAFEGCSYLELLSDKADSRIFFTYSIWDNEESLNKYRNSSLFKETWAKTKLLFDEKPQAWSLSSKYKLG